MSGDVTSIYFSHQISWRKECVGIVYYFVCDSADLLVFCVVNFNFGQFRFIFLLFRWCFSLFFNFLVRPQKFQQIPLLTLAFGRLLTLRTGTKKCRKNDNFLETWKQFPLTAPVAQLLLEVLKTFSCGSSKRDD